MGNAQAISLRNRQFRQLLRNRLTLLTIQKSVTTIIFIGMTPWAQEAVYIKLAQIQIAVLKMRAQQVSVQAF
jgi:hypothetical protein